MNDGEQLTQILENLDQINFALIVLIAAGAWLAILVTQRFLPWIAERLPGRSRTYILPLIPALRLLILGTAIGQIIPLIITPSPQNLLAILGAAGLAIGFAFKDYVSSLIAGVVAVFERLYQPGDWIEIGSDYGEVQVVGLRSVRILTPDDTTVFIPHARMWNDNVANANASKQTHLCVADFYLRPDHDARAVRQKLWEVGITSGYIDLAQPVIVLVMEKPWGTHYRLKAYPIDGRDQFQFISDLTVRGKAALAELGAMPVVVPAVPWTPEKDGIMAQ
jgi:small conductance mechanosensitive channel